MAGHAAQVVEQPLDPGSLRSVSSLNWFADHGYNHRPGTKIKPLVMGDVAFDAVATALQGAQSSINMAFWGLDPGILLRRGTISNYNEADALGNILLAKVAAGVKVNVVVWDHPARGIGSGGSGTDEIVKEPNSRNLHKLFVLAQLTPNLTVKMTNAHSRLVGIGSFHQKFIIVDIENAARATAFIMGHNMMPNYWDQASMLSNNPKRNFYLEITGVPGPTQPGDGFTYRAHATDKLGPFLDVSTQIWGGGVADAYHSFERIWKKNGGTLEPTYAEISGTNFAASAPGPKAGRSQVAATFHSEGEASIRQHYLKAISNANKYVFILNQYLRDQELTDEIIATLKQRGVPDQKNITIIIISNDWEDGIDDGGAPQVGHDTAVLKKFTDSRISVSYSKLITNAAAARRPIYIHSKVLLVDDVFYTIGSANYNDRSLRSDPELNIGAVDPPVAQDLRAELMNMVIGRAMNELQDEPQDSEPLWLERVNENKESFNSGQRLPNGTAVPFQPTKWRRFPSKWASVDPAQTGEPPTSFT